MRIDKKSFPHPPEDISVDGDEAVRPLAFMAAFSGFLFTIGLYSAMMISVVKILNAQEAIDWEFTWWQYPALSGIYLLWRAFTKTILK